MAPIPFVFAGQDEVIAAMRSPAVQKDIDAFMTEHSCSSAVLVRHSVTGNTFRAFHLRKLGLSPSQCYRAWTTEWIEKIVEVVKAQHQTLNNQVLRRHLIDGSYKLDAHWRTMTAGAANMGFGRAAKLLGLSVKHVLWHERLSHEQRKYLAESLDVPLDSYTLQGIRKALPELEVPSNATMNFVQSEAQYVRIQDAIRRMCPSDLIPLHYETVTWRLSHPGIK